MSIQARLPLDGKGSATHGGEDKGLRLYISTYVGPQVGPNCYSAQPQPDLDQQFALYAASLVRVLRSDLYEARFRKNSLTRMTSAEMPLRVRRTYCDVSFRIAPRVNEIKWEELKVQDGGRERPHVASYCCRFNPWNIFSQSYLL